METKRNLKYFTAPPISIPSLIGWAITLVGVIMLMVRYLRFAGIVVTIVGVAFVVFASGGASNDTDLEYQISERIKNLQERSEKKFENLDALKAQLQQDKEQTAKLFEEAGISLN